MTAKNEGLILYQLEELHKRLAAHMEEEVRVQREHGTRLEKVQTDVTALSLAVEHRLTKVETKGAVISAFVSALIAGVATWIGRRT